MIGPRLTLLWRLAASGLALAAVAWLGQRGPFPARTVGTELPPEASEGPHARPSRVSGFMIDGLPMALETTVVDACDADTWSPRDTAHCGPDCLIVDIQRAPAEVLAVWMELDETAEPSMAATATSAPGTPPPPDGDAVHHAARLICGSTGRGELTHTRTAVALDLAALERRLGEPVAERAGPVPLLADSVQLMQLRNLDWTIYLDQPTDPATALERFQAIMLARGWRHKPVPAEALEEVAPDSLPPDGRVLVRDGAMCLASSSQIEDRDLLLIACLGRLTEPGGNA